MIDGLKFAVALLAVVTIGGLADTQPPEPNAHLVRSGPLPGKDRELERREARQTANLEHCRYVANHGRGRSLASHRRCVRWLKPELAQTRRLLEPPHPVVDGCLSNLIEEESGWDHTATNPVTGAYGLPQALPGSKMASAGSDWRTNPATQIRWMIGYVTGRYGGSCGALAFFYANNWY